MIARLHGKTIYPNGHPLGLFVGTWMKWLPAVEALAFWLTDDDIEQCADKVGKENYQKPDDFIITSGRFILHAIDNSPDPEN